MRILFVTKAHLPLVGGAQRTLDALAQALTHRGHDVTVLAAQPARLPWGAAADEVNGYAVRRSAVPLCELPGTVAELAPDVVVVNSFAASLPTEPLLQACGTTPALVYAHDGSTVRPAHVVRTAGVRYAAVSRALAARIGEPPQAHLPPIVERAHYRVPTSRRVALFVNPRRLKGLATMLELVGARPDIPFAFAKAWAMSPAHEAELDAALRHLPNLELRDAVDDPALLYGDARVLLAPSLSPEGWGRVASEALASGIPVLASAVDGLTESVGDGGELVALETGTAGWLAALERLWDDPGAYADAEQRAEQGGRRPELEPEAVARRFEAIVGPLLGDQAARPAAAGSAVRSSSAASSRSAIASHE